MNTKIYYMYRDASNYKSVDSVVFKDELSDEEVVNLYNHLEKLGKEEGSEYFIAEQLGFEVLRGGCDIQHDHCWHEWCEIGGSDHPDDIRANLLQRSTESARSGSVHDFYKKVMSVEKWDIHLSGMTDIHEALERGGYNG